MGEFQVIPALYFRKRRAIHWLSDQILPTTGLETLLITEPVWLDVHVERDGLVTLIKEEPALPVSSPASFHKATIGAERKCETWLVELMRAGKSTKRKHDYFEEACDHFQVSRRSFDRAWGNAIAESGNSDWSRPGRKS